MVSLTQASHEIGPLSIFEEERIAFLHGQPLRALPDKQWRLLLALAERPGRVVPRQELMETVWGITEAMHISTRTLDSTASHLRGHLRRHGDDFVVNVWGIGYRLVNPILQEAS